MSAFVLSVVFLGFDPENLAVGAAGTWEGVAGFALGSIIGAYMVAVALAFGVTALALLVSVEELARELPAAWKGRSEITYGNVVGSVIVFFLFNAGIIALVRPVPVGDEVRYFYLPVAFATVVATSAFVARGRVGRLAGVLLLLYAAFVGGGAYLYGLR